MSKIILALTATTLFFILFSCSSVQVKDRNGNVETIISKKGNKLEYKLVFVYDGDRIVRGEYWLPVDKSKTNKKPDPKSNILADTAIAKKFDEMLKGQKVVDEADVTGCLS